MKVRTLLAMVLTIACCLGASTVMADPASKAPVSTAASAGTTSAVTELTRSEVQKLRNTTLPILVEFYTDICPDCLNQAPVLEAVARKYAGKMLFYKINAQSREGSALAAQAGLPRYPAIIVVYPSSAKREAVAVAGFVDQPVLEKFIDKCLAPLPSPSPSAAPSVAPAKP